MKKVIISVLVLMLLCGSVYATDFHYVVDNNKPQEYAYQYYNDQIPSLDIYTPVSVHCEEWELEELARLVYWEACGESDICQRAICEVVFNQLNYGAWGDTLDSVIFSTNNYEPAYRLYWPDTEYDKDILSNIRTIVHDVYYNGISLPPRIMFFRADYYHQWKGAIPEFNIGVVHFSSSYWCDI